MFICLVLVVLSYNQDLLLLSLTQAYNSESVISAEATASHLQLVETSRRQSVEALASAHRQLKRLPPGAAGTDSSKHLVLGRGGRLSLVRSNAM